jgi:hypothetical protein
MDFKLEHHDADHFVALHSAEHADLKAVADHCANLRSIGATGSKDMKLAASVPTIFIMQYCNVNGITFAEFMRDHTHADRMLADPALSHFRVWEGRL